MSYKIDDVIFFLKKKMDTLSDMISELNLNQNPTPVKRERSGYDTDEDYVSSNEQKRKYYVRSYSSSDDSSDDNINGNTNDNTNDKNKTFEIGKTRNNSRVIYFRVKEIPKKEIFCVKKVIQDNGDIVYIRK